MLLRDTTEAIWAFTGTVLGLIVCVGIASIVRQIRHNSEGSTQADKWENATDAVMGFIDGDETRMARFSKLLKSDETRPIVIEALSNVARTSVNCAVHLRDRNADVAILRQWVADSLEDKDAGRRAHACEVVGTLRLRACRGMVLAATGDDDVNVKVSATRAMAVIDPESAVGVLLGLIEDEGTWAADLLADVLQRIPADATQAVVQRARDWGATPALVKLLASCPSALANDVLLGALETDDAELRARTAEAVHASTPQAVAALCGLLTDPHEGTRLSAVRSLGRAANPEALLTLSSALSDSSRLVRFAAASGIAATPGGGDFLSRVVTGTDANAAEAAELALWRLNSGALASTAVPSKELLEEILATQPEKPAKPAKPAEPAEPAEPAKENAMAPVLSKTKKKTTPTMAKSSKPATVKPDAPLSSAKRLAIRGTATPQPKAPKTMPARRFDEVVLWLDAYLKAQGGVASAPVVKAAAAREGIAERTLERVRPTIASSARQGFGEPANWELLELPSAVSASA